MLAPCYVKIQQFHLIKVAQKSFGKSKVDKKVRNILLLYMKRKRSLNALCVHTCLVARTIWIYPLLLYMKIKSPLNAWSVNTSLQKVVNDEKKMSQNYICTIFSYKSLYTHAQKVLGKSKVNKMFVIHCCYTWKKSPLNALIALPVFLKWIEWFKKANYYVRSSYGSNLRWRFHKNFVAFSECMNFTFHL